MASTGGTSSQKHMRNLLRKCVIAGCERTREDGGSGRCVRHYHIYLKEKHAEGQVPRARASKICKAIFASGQKCSRPVVSAASGLCKAHEAEARDRERCDVRPQPLDIVGGGFEGREEELIAAQG
jgi:hypothetical protein